MSQRNLQMAGTIYKDDAKLGSDDANVLEDALRRSNANTLGKALVPSSSDKSPSRSSLNPSQGSANFGSATANPAWSPSTGPQVSYSTTNEGHDNFTDNGDGKSGEKTRFRTSNTGSGNETRNGRGVPGPARAPNTIVGYITDNLGDANHVFNGVIGDPTKEKTWFRLLMMAIMVISVLVLLFRITHTPLSVAIHLFVLLGSILGLVYSERILA